MDIWTFPNQDESQSKIFFATRNMALVVWPNYVFDVHYLLIMVPPTGT